MTNIQWRPKWPITENIDPNHQIKITNIVLQNH